MKTKWREGSVETAKEMTGEGRKMSKDGRGKKMLRRWDCGSTGFWKPWGSVKKIEWMKRRGKCTEKEELRIKRRVRLERGWQSSAPNSDNSEEEKQQRREKRQ